MADDDSQLLGQDEIEALLKQATGDAGESAPEPPKEAAPTPSADEPAADDGPMGQNDIEAMLAAGAGAAQSPVAEAPPVTEAPPENTNVGQDDIEAMLAGAAGGTPPAPANESAETESIGQAEIEAMMSGGAGSPPIDNSSGDSSGETESLGQDQIEALMAGIPPTTTQTQPTPQAQPAAQLAAQPAAPAAAPPPQAVPTAQRVTDDLELLMMHTQEAISSVDQPNHPELEGLRSFSLNDFTATPPSKERATLELLRDVELDVKIELGRTDMYLEDVLKLRKGSVVALEKLAGDPVDVYVNGRLVARGEVLVLSDNFCVRVAELISGVEKKTG